MRQSTSIEKLAPALVAAQAEIGGAVKGAENPFFKSKYADLNSVILAMKPIFVKHGFALVQLPCSDENGVGVVTRLQHESGEFFEQEFTLPLAKSDPQQAGSAITYAKRYALKALGLMPDLDDDAESAMFRQATFTTEQREQFIDMIANKDGWGLKRIAKEYGNDTMSALFKSFKKGEVTLNKNLVRDHVNVANEQLKKTLAFLDECICNSGADMADSAQEALAELGATELKFVMAGLSEIQQQQLTDMGVTL